MKYTNTVKNRLLSKKLLILLSTMLFLAASLMLTPQANGSANIDFHTLSTGSRGANVQAAQQLLAHRNYEVGPIDGAYGPLTEKAVKEFQTNSQLSADGEIGPQTWNRLIVNITEKTSGSHVKALTILLNKKDNKGIAENYGPITTQRVKDFQKHMGITVDGVVGPETWKHLVFQYTQPEFEQQSLCKGLSGALDTANYDKEGWGSPATVAHLEKASTKIYQKHGTQVAFRDLSFELGGQFPIENGSRQHASHQTGMDIDLRPMSTTDAHCTTPLTYRSNNYSQQRTSDLIAELRNSSETLGTNLMKVTLFNDPTLIRRFPEVRYASNHDNHLHARFCTTYYKFDSKYDC